MHLILKLQEGKLKIKKKMVALTLFTNCPKTTWCHHQQNWIHSYLVTIGFPSLIFTLNSKVLAEKKRCVWLVMALLINILLSDLDSYTLSHLNICPFFSFYLVFTCLPYFEGAHIWDQNLFKVSNTNTRKKM